MESDDSAGPRMIDVRPFRQRPLKRLVKCLVSLAFFAFSEPWNGIRKILGWTRPGFATVIYYHQIPKEQCRRFANQLDHLLRWSVPVRADSPAPLPAGSRCTVVTFDDGWLSFAEIALPELERRMIPVTLFMITDYAGRRLEAHSDERLLSNDELVRLAPDLVMIGSHTLTHCRLTSVSEDHARHELRESRVKLEELVKRNVRLFSFPFGVYNERLVQLCREAGYERVFTGIPGRAFSHVGEFASGRVRVDPDDWRLEFHLKLMGAYRWMPLAVSAKWWITSHLPCRHEIARVIG
ncbi:MAG: polysaccharide deacetylase family protein [Candidatus Binataceae bacterium]